MLLLVLRKMRNNKWLVICLLIGSILTAAMISSIPMYTNGILQRMLTRDLVNSQKSSGYFPGYYLTSANLSIIIDPKERVAAYKFFDESITKEIFINYGLPALTQFKRITLDIAMLRDGDPGKLKKLNSSDLNGISGIQDHVEIINGRIFANQKNNGVYEVIVNQETMKLLDLAMDKTYDLSDFMNDSQVPIMKVKVVGVFKPKDVTDNFWNGGLSTYSKSLIMDYSLFEKEFIETDSSLISSAKWFYALDYKKITLSNLHQVIDTYQNQKSFNKDYGNISETKLACITILENYFEREKQLKTTLWILQIPILIMLAFYIFMVSQLIIDHEKNEIAILKSRGASRLQIFLLYLFESLILSLITIIVGPPLGMLLCSIMGSSNGFLEFVQRTSLNIALSGNVYFYALLAVLLFIITMLIPAFISSKVTIVQHKQAKSRFRKSDLWQKYFLDLIMLALSGYGFYRYSMQKKMLIISGVKGTDLAIDPILFLTSTFFVLGAGMLFLRLYPYLIRMIFHLGKKIWSPVFYASFIHVGRSSGQEKFLMLFIIFTLSTGIFSANAARTINKNSLDKAYYETGADMTIKAHWQTDAPAQSDGEDGQAIQTPTTSSSVHYIEPYFMPYTQLSGVLSATKVFRTSNAITSMPTTKSKETSVGKVNLMGIIPSEFGKIAWFRRDLLSYNINQYLNLMTKNKRAVLLSRTFQQKFGLKEGDPVSISWSGQQGFSGVVYAFIDYWPTFNQNTQLPGQKPVPQYLVVADLNYIQSETLMEPYEVWIKKKPDATSEQIYTDMKEKQLIENEMIVDTMQKVIEIKNDPMLQGTNGSLTLGFIVTISISTIGFLIYWILSIQGRLLQFGIFRAMGLSVKHVIGMLICEQVLISGIAVFMGIVIGKLTSGLFVRLFEIVYSAEQQVLPFNVVEYIGDYYKLYAVISFMLITGFIILGTIVSRIKINQVIKLGED